MRPIDLTGFKPAPLRDQPQPTLLWVDIADLVIDPRYQRNITAKGRGMIQRIANGWDWRKSQPILVAGTEAGKYAVVDGHHRTRRGVYDLAYRALRACGLERRNR